MSNQITEQQITELGLNPMTRHLAEQNEYSLIAQAEAAIRDYNDMMAELQPLLDAIKPFLDRTGRQEKHIKDLVLKLQETVEHAGWKFTYRKGSEKEDITVDAKAIAGYAAAHPEVEQFITRSTKKTEPSVARSKA